MGRLRPGILFPFALSIVAFALTLVVLLAGTSKGTLEGIPIANVNVTNVGRDIIEFNPISSASSTPVPTSAAAAVARDVSTATATATSTGINWDPFHIFPTSVSLPTLATDFPSLNLSGGGLLGGISTAAGGLVVPTATGGAFGPLQSVFAPLTNGLTSYVDNGLESAVNLVTESIIQQVGLQQWYSMYLRTTCKGNYTLNDKGEQVQVTTACERSILNFSTPINTPSSIVIGNTNISVPVLAALPEFQSILMKQIQPIATQLFVFYIIAAVCFGIIIITSPFFFFVRTSPLPHTSIITKIMFYSLVLTSQLAMLATTVGSMTISIALSAVTTQTKHALESLSVFIHIGHKMLAIVWVITVLTIFINGYFILVYFQEFRTWAIGARDFNAPEKVGLIGRKKKVEGSSPS